MTCKGCYKPVKEGYCLRCRKTLFDGLRTSPVLPFDTPKDENLVYFQEHSKRLSISGVQLKYSLRLHHKELVLTEKGGAYILKPIPPAQQLRYTDQVPENEHLTMQIAKQIFKIPTAENALVYFKDGTPAYLTKRFDVAADGTKYLQEDFAQLTNRTKRTHGETFKYEGSYEEIGRLIHRFVPAAMIAAERFFHQLVFNYVFSNADAHLKNFSLLRNPKGEYQLTPAYDLLSTVIHSPQESDTALDLYEGSIDAPFFSTYGYYGRPDFLELAKRLSINLQRAEKMINQYVICYDEVEKMVEHSFLIPEVKTLYIKNIKDKLTQMNVVR